jgi:hypothetical protein
MRVAEDRASWREIGEAYVQQWTCSGLMMMMILYRSYIISVLPLTVRSTTRDAIHLQFDISADALEIRAVQSV